MEWGDMSPKMAVIILDSPYRITALFLCRRGPTPALLRMITSRMASPVVTHTIARLACVVAAIRRVQRSDL